MHKEALWLSSLESGPLIRPKLGKTSFLTGTAPLGSLYAGVGACGAATNAQQLLLFKQAQRPA